MDEKGDTFWKHLWCVNCFHAQFVFTIFLDNAVHQNLKRIYPTLCDDADKHRKSRVLRLSS